MKIKLYSQAQRIKALEAVKNAPEGFFVDIKASTRSLEQNSLLWRLLTVCSESIPWTVNGQETMLSAEDWKDVITASLHQENRIAKCIKGGFVMLGRSTSKMTVSQMTELIEFIYSFLAEHGVVIDEQSLEW